MNVNNVLKIQFYKTSSVVVDCITCPFTGTGTLWEIAAYVSNKLCKLEK